MPIQSPVGTLDFVNARIGAAEIRATSNIGVANVAPTKQFSVGDKFHVSTTDADAVTISGNVVANVVKVGSLEIVPSYDFAAVSNVGNTTSNIIQFANATTGFTTTANVEIGGNITLTANAQVKVGSNVLAEYTGPHRREPKEVPLKKYPEIVFAEGKFDYNTTTNTFTQAGYTITSSSNYGGDDVNSLFTAWRSFTGLTNGYGPGWTSGGGGAHPSAYTNGVANSNQSLTNIDTATSTGNVSSRNGAWIKLELPTKIKLGRVDFYDRYDNVNVIGGGSERVSEAFVYGGNSNSGPWYELGKQSDATNMAHYTDDNPASLTINTTSYYKYYIIQPTAQENLTRVYVSYGQLMFYGTEEPAPVGDLSLDTTLKSTFNSVRSNNYVMYFDGEGFIPGDTNSNNLVDNSSTSVIHHNATYDSTGKYWTLDGSTESNVTTGSLGFEGDVPHTVSMWVNASNVEDKQLFSIGSGYDKSFLKVNDTQIAANTWHNVTYAYQGEGGSKVTYVDGRKVEEAQVEDTFGDYPPFAMTGYETGGYRVSASSESTSTRVSWKAFNDVQNISNITEDNWESGAKYSSVSPYNANQTTYITDTNGTTHYGEWIAIEMPEKLKFGYFNMVSPVANRRPDSMVIVGSNDGGVTFDHIKTISSVTYPSNNTTTIAVNSAYAYNKFYFIVTSVDGAVTVTNISHLAIYGHKEGDLTRFPEPTRVLKYPHIAMTGYAQRGYVVSASAEEIGNSRFAWSIFDEDDNTQWGSGNATYGADPYNVNTNLAITLITLADSTTRRGHWIKLELPRKLYVTSYYQKALVATRRPDSVCILGSNDDSDWYVIKDSHSVPNQDENTISVNAGTAYKYIKYVVESISGVDDRTVVNTVRIYGTEEDTGTPAIVGGPFAGKVANFRVYDQYLGDERIQEIYDAQKDAFGHKKSSMTFYKGRIGVGTTEPEGALTVVDEPHALAKFPARAVSADDSYVEEDGQIKLSAADGSGYQAFDGLTSTSWTAAPTRNTRLSKEVDFGAWLKIQTPESVSLKKAEIESNPDWRQVGSEVQGTIANEHFGRSVACSHDGTRVIAGGFTYNSSQGRVEVYDWNGSAWTRVGQTLTGVADGNSPSFGKYVAISGDGNIIAIAAPNEHVSGDADKGTVRVYYLNGGQWTILPDSGSLTDASLTDVFIGSAVNAYLGNGAIQLSYDGKTIAMCEYGYDDVANGRTDAGRVLVYQYSDGEWSYKGTGATQFVGSAANVHFGFGLSMSEDGNCLAIGTLDAGYFVEVYTWNGSTWGQKGSRINQPAGTTTNDYFGQVVSISNDGNTLAIGMKDADVADGAIADNNGLVLVYHWTGIAWGTPHKLQYNEIADEEFGLGVVLSGDGKRLVVCAGEENSVAGELFTFEYTGGSWIMREAGVQGLNGYTPDGHLGWGWVHEGHSFTISRDGSTIVAGELGYDTPASNAGRFRVFSMPSNIKSIWGSNDDVNWTKITTAPTREEATSNVAGVAFGYDDRLEFKNLDNPNYYKYHAIVADAFTRLKDVKLFGVRKQGSSTLHDGALTLTKNLDVPRIGPALDADDTPRRDRLVVEYNTSTNPVEDGLVRDTSGRGNDACMKGSASYSSATKAIDIAGVPNGISAPSTSAYLDVGRRLPFKGNQVHTISFWHNKKNRSQTQSLISLWKENTDYNTTGNHSGVMLEASGQYSFWHWGADQIFTDPLGNGSDGWRHVVAVYTGGTVADQKLYINGIGATFHSYGSGSGTATIDITNAKMTMGQDYYRGNYYFQSDTEFSGIKIYDTALTAQEVKTLYDMGRCDEGGHVVNFSKTRVGIGLGDGEVPRGDLDVRGDVRTTKLSVYDVSSNLTAASITTNSSGVTNETSFSVLDMKDVYGAGGYIKGFHNPYVGNGLQLGAWSLGARTNELMTILATGNVGIGTSNPSYPLSVHGHIQTKREVAGSHDIMGLVSAYYGDFLHIGAWNAAGSQSKNIVMNYLGGNVGVGTNAPYAKLHVVGASGAFNTTNPYNGLNDGKASYMLYSSATVWTNTTGGFGNISIYGSDDILSGKYIGSFGGYITASDSRIKKEIVDVEDGSALETLRLLKPKQYKYKDEVNRGSEPVWGFIAQEVRDTLPYATQLRTECLPNIYEMANVSDSKVITFTNFDTSDLESNAMVLKVFDKDDTEHLVNITEVVDDHSVRVEENLSEWTGSVDESGNVVAGNQLFVYGQRVDDYVFLKKDAIWTVATAALQEVDRQLQAEKAKVTTLETQVADLLARVQTLESA